MTTLVTLVIRNSKNEEITRLENITSNEAFKVAQKCDSYQLIRNGQTIITRNASVTI